MPNEQKTVFISYRRKPASYIARAIFQNLTANGYDVFMDVEGIDAGNFGTIIDNQIKARAHFLIILTSGTVARFDEEKDWLRHEIEFAMEHKRNIVPLLIDGFKFNKTAKKYLTGKLADLPRLNGLHVPHEFFEEAMEKLRTRFLKTPEYIETEPPPPNETPEVARKIDEIAAKPPPTKDELSAEDYFNMAIALDDNSDQEIAFYTDAIRLNPRYTQAYNNLGFVFYNRQEYKIAMQNFKKAIRLYPRYTQAHINLALSLLMDGKLDDALGIYNKVLRYDPKNIDIYYNRGTVYRSRGNLRKAIADFRKYIELGGEKHNGEQDQVERWIRELQAQLDSQP